jgi:hypothetical protein
LSDCFLTSAISSLRRRTFKHDWYKRQGSPHAFSYSSALICALVLPRVSILYELRCSSGAALPIEGSIVSSNGASPVEDTVRDLNALAQLVMRGLREGESSCTSGVMALPDDSAGAEDDEDDEEADGCR